MRTRFRTTNQKPAMDKRVSAVIELQVSSLSINLIGEHCPHCRAEKRHLMDLAKVELLNH